MEIIKQLRVNGVAQVNAVLLSDEGEVYPVFLETLHNKLVFDSLMESGYKLAGLPYNFVKDGNSIDKLTVEDYVANPQVEQNMYDMLGQKMTEQELLSHIDTTIVQALPTLPKKVTITTKEQLLDYLHNRKTGIRFDNMPLNYFVADELLVPISEVKNPEHEEILYLAKERRRNITLKDFQTLILWLQENAGLGPNPTPLDIVEAYHAWGPDGVRFNPIMKKREFTYIRPGHTSTNGALYDFTTALFDVNGSIIVEPDKRNKVWMVPWTAPGQPAEIKDRYVKGLLPGQVRPIQAFVEKGMDKCVWSDGANTLELIDTEYYINGSYNPLFSIQNPISVSNFVPIELALPQNKEKFYDYTKLITMADTLLDKLKDKRPVSSYAALLNHACTPKTAIRTILEKNFSYEPTIDYTEFSDTNPLINQMRIDYESGGSENSTGVGIKVCERVIDMYMEGQRSSNKWYVNTAFEVISNIIDGTINIDLVQKGAADDALVDRDTFFTELYAAHYILGIPFETLYDKIRAVNMKTKFFEVSANGMTLQIATPSINMKVSGFENDLKHYTTVMSRDCTVFYWITTVGKEMMGLGENGEPLSDRDIAIEFYWADKSQKAVKDVIEHFVTTFQEKLSYTSNITEERRADLSALDFVFAMKSWFRLFFTGEAYYPTDVGGDPIVATPAIMNIIKNNTRCSLETLTSMCEISVTTEGSKHDIEFLQGCVNAFITIDHVIPKAGQTIKAVPIKALYNNYRDTSPAIFNTLVNNGVISPDHVSWKTKYKDNHFKKTLSKSTTEFIEVNGQRQAITNVIPEYMVRATEVDSLPYYMKNAESEIANWEETVPFISATHPADLQFIGSRFALDGTPLIPNDSRYIDVDDGNIHNSAEENDTKLREGAPVTPLNKVWQLTKDSVHINSVAEIAGPVKDIYIRLFTHFNMDTLMIIPDAIDKIPGLNDHPIAYIDNEHVLLVDERRVVDVTNLPSIDQTKYPFRHIYDRTYLLRTFDNRLWEVHI